MLLGVLGGLVTMAEGAGAQEEKLREYLTRLIGKPVDGATPMALSSARKAQLAAWLRREGIAFQYAQIDRPSITIADILSGGAASPTSSKPQVAATPRASVSTAVTVAVPAVVPPVAGLNVGIDMESAKNLPAAEDFRTHPFYQENFSAREIAHCLQAGDPRESFCGLWAAKEAIVKSGAARRAGSGVLAAIDISHDDGGGPIYPGCAISISHEGGMAVAVCLNFGGAAA